VGRGPNTGPIDLPYPPPWGVRLMELKPACAAPRPGKVTTLWTWLFGGAPPSWLADPGPRQTPEELVASSHGTKATPSIFLPWLVVMYFLRADRGTSCGELSVAELHAQSAQSSSQQPAARRPGAFGTSTCQPAHKRRYRAR
jgi:hypothetical protein